MKVLTVDESEPFGANAICLGTKILYSGEHLKTAAKILAAGFELETVSISELAKAEAGLTCLSLIVVGKIEKATQRLI